MWLRSPLDEIRNKRLDCCNKVHTCWPTSVGQDLLLSPAPLPSASITSQNCATSLRPGVQAQVPVENSTYSKRISSYFSKLYFIAQIRWAPHRALLAEDKQLCFKHIQCARYCPRQDTLAFSLFTASILHCKALLVSVTCPNPSYLGQRSRRKIRETESNIRTPNVRPFTSIHRAL